MLRFSWGILIASVIITGVTGPGAAAQGLTAAEAVRTAQRTGRPLLAIATSPTCGPCRALKSVLYGDETVRQLMDNFVYLEMDSQSPDFQDFHRQYSGNYTGDPMVYMVRADDTVMYGQSGSLNAEQLQLLLGHGIKNSGQILRSDELAKVERVYEQARQQAAKGKLVSAVKSMAKIANIDSYAQVISEARATQSELEELIGEWIERIDQRLAAGQAIHANAYRLAELYVELPKSADLLRKNTMDLLAHYESNEPTSIAIKQNMRLVRARLEEQRDLCDAAIASYEMIRDLEPTSPAGEFASQRLNVVMTRRQNKLTANLEASRSGTGATAVP